VDPFKVVITSACKSASSECFVISKQSKETIYAFIMLLWIFISTWHDLVLRDILCRVHLCSWWKSCMVCFPIKKKYGMIWCLGIFYAECTYKSFCMVCFPIKKKFWKKQKWLLLPIF